MLRVKKCQNVEATPDTIITAKTNTGLSLDVPVEVVKSTASISGKVFTSKQLIKGYVKSLGPKSHCKLDSAGNYVLPKVYRGHDRKVCAVWYTLENGKKIKHKQIKVIDFFNADLTNFNFGEEATPTPTATETPTVTPTPRSPMDSYYRIKASNVIYQFKQWKASVGTEQAIQNTVDWLNEKNQELPVPEGILDAAILPSDNQAIWINFKYGMGFSIYFGDAYKSANAKLPDYKKLLNFQNNKKYRKPFIKNKSTTTTVRSNKILILDSNVWWTLMCDPKYNLTVSIDLLSDLINAEYPITFKWVGWEHLSQPDPNTLYPSPVDPNDQVAPCYLRDNADMSTIIRPDDFKHFDQYGIIYYNGHGNLDCLTCCVLCENDTELIKWMGKDPNNIEHPMWRYINDTSNNGMWYIQYCHYAYNDSFYVPILMVTDTWIGYQNLSKSLVFISACLGSRHNIYSFITDNEHSQGNPDGAAFYIGPDNPCNPCWAERYSYYFFYYMMHGFIEPVDMPDYTRPPDITDPEPDIPMSAKEAYDTLSKYNVSTSFSDYNGGTYAHMLPRIVTSREFYFPAPLEITVKNNLIK